MTTKDWTTFFVGQIASPQKNALVGGPFGSDLVSRDYVPDGVPVIRGANMGKGRWIGGDFVFVSVDKADSLAANCAKSGDLVFTQRGTIGQVALVPGPGPGRYLISQSQMKLTVDPSKADPLFLFYVFSTSEHQDYIQQNAIRTGVPHTNLSILRNTPVRLPSLREQKSIASVLSALDAKIELNQRLNAALEGMARLLYDYWFVQHDFPISTAQAAAMGKPRLVGKPYRSSGGPMVFHSRIKRDIPQGWESGSAKDLFIFNPSISIKKGEVAAYLDMDALPTSGFMTKQIQRKEFKGGTKFTNGDVLVARITPCLENGKTGLVTLLEDCETAFGSTEFIVLRGRTMPLSGFGCCLSRSDYFRKYAVGNMTGTSGRKRLEAPVLEKLPLSLPPPELLRKFENICAPMLKLMTKHNQQNHHLAKLRDWLLPMLMNGQVRVG